MKKPLTQSEKWQDLQDDLGEVSHFVVEKDYQFLAIEKHTKAGNYLFLPYGPVTTSQDSFKRALHTLKSLAKDVNALFIRVEPQDTSLEPILKEQGTKVHDIDPADTWVLDLTPDEATLKSHFSQGTRTRYNNYAKKGITVEPSSDPDDIRHLVSLQKTLYDEKHLTAFSEKYLATELAQPFASLYLVKYNKSTDEARKAKNDTEGAGDYPQDGQVLAASLFFDYDGTRYYMQSAADQRFKKLPATVALLTKAIFDAKEQGIKEFDFWGIAPDGADRTHPWYGFTEFKKSFGGEPRHYAGTYDIVLKPIRYRIFNLLKRLQKSL